MNFGSIRLEGGIVTGAGKMTQKSQQIGQSIGIESNSTFGMCLKCFRLKVANGR